MSDLTTAKNLSNALAQRVGYNEPITDTDRLRLAESLVAAMRDVENTVQEFEAVVARANVLLGDHHKPLAQLVDALRTRIEAAAKREAKAKQDEADREWQGRA